MPYTFHFIFRGLSAFVFDRSLKDRLQPPTKAVVLLPNLLKPRQLSHTNPTPAGANVPQILEAHFPLLLFDQTKVSAKTTPDLTDSNGYAAFRLTETSVDFLPDGTLNPNLDLVLGAIDPSMPPGSNRSLEWLVEMEEVAPDYAELDPSLLSHNPPPANSGLVTRVNLTGGSLEAGAVSTQNVEIYPGGSSRFTVSRRIARELVLVIRNIKASVDLNLTHYGPKGSVVSPVSLSPKDPETQEPVEVYIQNLESDMTLGPSSYGGLKPSADFEIFFDLSKNQEAFPGIKPVPIALTSVLGGNPLSGNGGMCPPASFRASGL